MNDDSNYDCRTARDDEDEMKSDSVKGRTYVWHLGRVDGTLSDYWHYRKLDIDTAKAVKFLTYVNLNNGPYPKLHLSLREDGKDGFCPECCKCNSRKVNINFMKVSWRDMTVEGLFYCEDCKQGCWPFDLPTA
jgi:hypothetical protein